MGLETGFKLGKALSAGNRRKGHSGKRCDQQHSRNVGHDKTGSSELCETMTTGCCGSRRSSLSIQEALL